MKMIEEKRVSPKSGKCFRQMLVCIFRQWKNQSWQLPNRMFCSQNCFSPKKK